MKQQIIRNLSAAMLAVSLTLSAAPAYGAPSSPVLPQASASSSLTGPHDGQEAALIISRVLLLSGQETSESGIQLVPGTKKWVEASVKMMIQLGFHGPEVLKQGERFDYSSGRELNKQELAALLFAMMLPAGTSSAK